MHTKHFLQINPPEHYWPSNEFWLVHITKCSFVKPVMTRLSKCSIKNLHMRLFFLTPSLIGSINHRIFLLTNRQVVLMGLSKMSQMSGIHPIIVMQFLLYLFVLLCKYEEKLYWLTHGFSFWKLYVSSLQPHLKLIFDQDWHATHFAWSSNIIYIFVHTSLSHTYNSMHKSS